MPKRPVAIVGRPNVGKSALFNRLAKRRISIVHDMPGVTRDRITTKCKLGTEPFTIIDTGGIGSNVDASFSEQVHAEVDIALGAAHLILFVVDAMDGLSPIDAELARRLRRADKPLLLVINKIDDPKHQPNATEFTRLGFKDYVLISAEHGRGIGELVQKIEAQLPAADALDETAAAEAEPLKIAIVGRPNVGKSSLTNAILNDARTLVSPISGTTRDAIDIPYERHGNRYILIDTAGIRARTRRDNSVEVFSAMRSEDSIRRADLCCLIIDATMGITMQDKKIAGLIQEAWRPCIIVVNKWDLIEDQTDTKEKLKETLEDFRAQLFFLNYAPLLLASAKTGAELTRLFKSIERVHAGAKARIGTGPLNRLLQAAMTAPGTRSSKRFKLLYAAQSDPKSRDSIPLPEFVFFVNDDKLLDASYRTYLEKQLRAHTPYEGIPLRLVFRARKPGEKSRKS